MSTESSTDSRAVMDYIRLIVHALESGSRASQKALGLSGAQLFVLQTLASAGRLSIKQLAAQSRTHQSSVSVVVSRLVEAGLVARSTAEEDGRRLDLSVTPAGRKVLRSTPLTPQARLLAALSGLRPTRLTRLRALLAEVVEASGMQAESAPMFFEPPAPKRRISPNKQSTPSK